MERGVRGGWVLQTAILKVVRIIVAYNNDTHWSGSPSLRDGHVIIS